jgi:hypothetical protein
MSYLSGPCPFICTDANCDHGKASVEQMDSVYQSLSPDLQSKFKSSHDAIMASLNANWDWYTNWIPFNATCCTICAIGVQADTLTQQMQTAAGQQPLDTGPSTGYGNPLPLPNLGLGGYGLLLLGVGALVIVGVFAGKGAEKYGLSF